MTIGTDTLAADNFNRANGALGGSTMSDGTHTWTTMSGSPTVASNKQSGNGSARLTDNSGIANADYSVQAEQYMKGDVSYNADGVSGELRLYGRVVDANNYYVAYISSNGGTNGAITMGIQKVVSGSPTTLANIALDDDGYTTWRFDLDGTSLTLFGDGGSLTNATDSTYTSTGYPGIASTGPIGTFSSDNFIVKGTAVAGGATLTAQSTSQSQASQNVALTQANTLAAQNTSQTQTSENADLELPGGLVTLTAQNTSQAQTSQNVSLTQANTLAAQNTSQSQTSQNVSLTLPGQTLSNPQVTMTYDGFSALSIDVDV